ncbi:TlpA disulfide reductase family protein [Parabacteroides sp. Marseille-P3160]|uniref:TlpA family protein disulfide reductase n=1 Tax=Parabacteroides sp. Marseille-P3160 TaxID=1917887 RepID=UPI0009BB2276|nr:TlpA disulfide reductase family protein [Parabacteroides sp. Marseille-P3160]
MKKHICFLFLLAFASLSGTAQEIVIERPPFSIWNYTSVEIDKIILSDTATILYMTGYEKPGQWIRIAQETYIRANGEKKMLRYATGMELSKEVYMDETGERSFVLYFPPIDPSTERIDFIESDCPTCFKIWGIELKSPVLTNRIGVPEGARREPEGINDTKSLPTPVFKAGIATLKGQVLGYIPELNFDGLVYANDPLTGEQYEYEFKLGDDGHFEVKVPLPCTMQVTLRLQNLKQIKVLLTPEQESSVYVDLQGIACQESRARIDKCPKGQWIYVNGANAELNHQFLSLSDSLNNTFNYDRFMDEILGMSASQYKEHVLNLADSAINRLKNEKGSQQVKELATADVKMQAMDRLFFGSYYLESAYRKANNIGYREKLTGYTPPVFSPDYYSFLKEYEINDPRYLYTADYCWAINNCKFIQLNEVNKEGTTKEMKEKLAGMADLTVEELNYLSDRVNSNFINWPEDKVNLFKKNCNEYVQSLRQTNLLVEKYQTLIQQIDSLNQLPGNNIQSILEKANLFDYRDLSVDKPAHDTLEAIQMKFFKQIVQPDTFSSDFRQAFYNKYERQIRYLCAEEVLQSLIGTDKGLAFDLMATQILASPLDEKTPLAPRVLTYVSKMDNPFYYTYLSQKNDELLREIEANKKKGNYTVHTVPEALTGDSLFYEIIKPFAGKVLLVDFWATWCSPCRWAMKQLEPAKQQLKEKGVAFIYLTDYTSPLNTFNFMITGIPGEHFRLTKEQLNSLKQKFGVNGVPSYLILNKKGEQTYFHVGFEGTQVLTREIESAFSD